MENRYDKYKDSGIAWIGEIPEHWEITSFKRKITINNGKDYKDFLDAEIYPVMGSGGCFAYCSNYMYDGEALLLGRKGTIDKPLYVKGKFWAVDTMFYAIPHANLDCKFAYYLALMFPFNLYSTSTSLPSLTQTDLGNILVAFPFLSEQQSIATYLDQKCGEIDELITLQEEMIIKLQSYKQSVITEAVTKGLDKNVPLKDSGIEWIGNTPEHWNKNKIIRLFGIIGSGTTPKSSKEDNYIGSVNWIQSGDINGGYIESCKNTISDTALKEYTTLKIYKAPFIIVAMYGASVGNISISNIDGCVNQACCVMNETKQNFKYLFYAMNSVKKYLIYKAEGGGQPNISQDKIKNTWLPIPPLSEQQSIANYLDQKCSEIDELISIKQQKIEKLKDYKKSLIFECVTGKRKV